MKSILFLAITAAAQASNVIVLPASGDRTATIVDVDTWKPIGTPVVGNEAVNAFTLLDGSKTYVVSKSTANTITVLSEGGKVLKSIDLATGLTDAALTSDGKRLLIVSMSDPALTIINTATDKAMARIPLAAPASSVAVNFDSRRAFIASPGNSTVTFIDLSTNAATGSLALRAEVKADSKLTYAPTGLVTIVAGDVLQEIDPRSQVRVVSTGNAPVDEFTGRYLFTSNGKTIQRLDAKTKAVTASLTLDNVAGPVIAAPVSSGAPVTRLVAINPRHSSSLPLVVRAFDADGVPISGQLVEFSRISGDTIQTWIVFTNVDGYAQTEVTPQPRAVSVYAQAGQAYDNFALDSPQSPSTPPQPNAFLRYGGSGQLVSSGSEAPQPLQVLVKASSGQYLPDVGLAGVSVDWAVTNGGGQVKSLRSVTDSRGIATATFIGPSVTDSIEPVRSQVTASTAFGEPVRFSLVTLPPSSTGVERARLAPPAGARIGGAAGSTVRGALSYRIVDLNGKGIPGISLEVGMPGEKRAEYDRSTYCEGSPLSNTDGIVTCNLFLGSGALNAPVYLGGLLVEYAPITLMPKDLTIRGLGASYARSGATYQTLRNPLIAVVEDSYGNAYNGVPVRWQVGEGSTVLFDTISLSAPGRYPHADRPSISYPSDGIVSSGVRFDPSQNTFVGASVGTNSAYFGLDDLDSIRKVDGDRQSAIAGEDFARPLVVDLKAAFRSTPLPGFPVTFKSTSGLVLSSPVVIADRLGRAEVRVAAGTAAGTYTVIASAGGVSTSFELTVLLKPGPSVRRVVNGASFAPGVSPCAVAQVEGTNLDPTITIGGVTAPVYHATAESVAVQVPCELRSAIFLLRTGGVGHEVTLSPYAPGIFENAGKAVAVRSDGTYVSATNPAERGEEIRLFVTGLGQATPALKTGIPGNGESVNAKVIVGLGAEGIIGDAVYAPTLTGTYIVKFRIPANSTSNAIGVAVQGEDGSFVHSKPSLIDVR